VPVSEVRGRQHLRSVRRRQLSVPSVRHRTFGSRDFSVVGPTVWNSLPDDPAFRLLTVKIFHLDLKTSIRRK